MKNCEKIYGVDPDSMVLCRPLFWGFPCLDYSGHGNDGMNNYGTTFQDGSLSFDGSSRITGSGAGIGTIGVGDYTVSARIYKKDSASGGAVAFGSYNPAWAINTNEHIYIYDLGSKIASTGTINLNSWQTITFVREGTGADETKYYINGDYDSPTTHSDSIPAVTTFAIGTDRVGGGAYDFNGLIDEICISNVARTADQIALFHDLPWALYQPVSRPVYFFQAAGEEPSPGPGLMALMI
jgi:hypothetical protein